MSYDFNADEVFEMAAQIERNGAMFYRNAAKNISDSSEKELLNRLADMEVDHIEVFEKLHQEISKKEKQKRVFDPNDESILYLQALADTKVFYEKEIDTTSMKEILKAALLAEKDAIVFYLGLKDLVPEELGQDRIDGIIKEEMKHVTLLSNELKKQ